MNLSRRKFFGVAVAAPVAAKTAVQEAASGMVLGYSGMPYPGGAQPEYGPDPSRTHWLSQLKKLSVKKVDNLRISRVERLDPDLVAMRSLSMFCRMRIQAERNAIREYESEKSWIMDRLKDFGGL